MWNKFITFSLRLQKFPIQKELNFKRAILTAISVCYGCLSTFSKDHI